MSVIVHAKIEKGIIKINQDLSKLGIEDGEVILEIKTMRKELFRRNITASPELVDEIISSDIDLLVD